MARPISENPRNIQIKFLVNSTEKEQFDILFSEQKAFGFKTKNEFCRYFILQNSALIIQKYKEKETKKTYSYLSTFVFQLQKLGNNLNQLMRYINKEKSIQKLSSADINRLNSITNSVEKLLKNIQA